MGARTLLTIEDFERLPDVVAKNKELVDGELVDVSGNTHEHNLLRDYLISVMRPWVREQDLGTVVSEQEYDFGGNVHGPDVSFYGRQKRVAADRKKRVQRFVPDLAIEIPSLNDTHVSIMRKIDRYLSSGTREVWLIDMELRQVTVFTRDIARIYRGADTITTDLLPGWSLPLSQLFEEL